MNCRPVGLVFFAAIFAATNLSITTPMTPLPGSGDAVAPSPARPAPGP
jgi:hypothetical protein